MQEMDIAQERSKMEQALKEKDIQNKERIQQDRMTRLEDEVEFDLFSFDFFANQ